MELCKIKCNMSQESFKDISFFSSSSIRDCATDLIRDVSDAAFDELIKYKLFENTNNIPTTTVDEQLDEPIPTQQDEYANMVKNKNAFV